MTRVAITLLVLLAATAMPAPAGAPLSQSLPGPAGSEPETWWEASVLNAIYAQESSSGRDCGIGAHGERGCYQIGAEWAADNYCLKPGVYAPADRACARSGLAKAERRCGRAVLWLAHYYNTGSCGPRPGHYAQDVQRRWMAAVIRAQRNYYGITLAMR